MHQKEEIKFEAFEIVIKGAWESARPPFIACRRDHELQVVPYCAVLYVRGVPTAWETDANNAAEI